MRIFKYMFVIAGWVVAAVFFVLFKFRNRITEPSASKASEKPSEKREKQSKKYFLGLMAVAKNESMVIRDYIQHYFEQGVDHIYLIDNGSTDDMAAIVKFYADYVSYFYMPEKMSQQRNYNLVFNSHVRHECEWVMINDVDEYVYGVNKPLRSYFLEQLKEYDAVQFLMENFGPSGHDRHPKDVRCSFTYRYPDSHAYDSPREKVAARTSNVVDIGIHYIPGVKLPGRGKSTLPTSMIRMNHYICMSKEYWEHVKLTRGDAIFDCQRTWKIVDSCNTHSIVEDRMLHDIVQHGYTGITIGIRLSGGLGSLLFQIAAGFAYCKRHRFEPILCSREPNDYIQNVLFHYFDHVLKPFKAHFSKEIPGRITGSYTDAFTEIPKRSESFELIGSFQSAQYFIHEFPASFWRTMLRPTKRLASNAVMLHVRRQFVKEGAEDRYYAQALARLDEERNEDIVIVVFSNDLEWCRATFPSAFPQYTWEFFSDKEDWEQLCVMTGARDFVISDSAFSWWAAFARERPDDGIVIAPAKWFGPGGPGEHTLYDGLSWIMI